MTLRHFTAGAAALALFALTAVPLAQSNPTTGPVTPEWTTDVHVDPAHSTMVLTLDRFGAEGGFTMSEVSLSLDKRTWSTERPRVEVLYGDDDGAFVPAEQALALRGHLAVASTFRTDAFGPTLLIDGQLIVDADPNDDGFDAQHVLGHIAEVASGDLQTFARWADGDVRVMFVGTAHLDVRAELAVDPGADVGGVDELPVARVAVIYDSRTTPQHAEAGAVYTPGLRIAARDISTPVPVEWFGVSSQLPSRFDLVASYVDGETWRVRARAATPTDDGGQGFAATLDAGPAAVTVEAVVDTDVGVVGADAVVNLSSGEGRVCTRLVPDHGVTTFALGDDDAVFHPGAELESAAVCVDNEGLDALARAAVDWGLDKHLAQVLSFVADRDLTVPGQLAFDVTSAGDIDLSLAPTAAAR